LRCFRPVGRYCALNTRASQRNPDIPSDEARHEPIPDVFESLALAASFLFTILDLFELQASRSPLFSIHFDRRVRTIHSSGFLGPFASALPSFGEFDPSHRTTNPLFCFSFESHGFSVHRFGFLFYIPTTRTAHIN